jgi:hypothetical protein
MLGLELVNYPVDHAFPTKKGEDSLAKMISGLNLIPTDIRRLHFVTLKASLADTNLDAFDAIAASIYLEGNLEKDIDGDFPYQEMALELRLNVSAFYKRCHRYPFTALALTEWATLVVQEYHYLVNNKYLAEMGMSAFDCLPSFSGDGRAWSANSNLLALRLTNTDISGPKPPLWADIYVLQLLSSKQDPPVYIAPVYGCVYQDPAQLSKAFPVVPTFKSVTSFYGIMAHPTIEDLPKSFTVVPILALDTYTFAVLSHNGVDDDSSVDLCQLLLDFLANVNTDISSFQRQPALQINGGLGRNLPNLIRKGYCAS